MTGSATQGVETCAASPFPTCEQRARRMPPGSGAPPPTGAPYDVGLDSAGQHLGLLSGAGTQGMGGLVSCWQVSDLEAEPAEVTMAGASVKDPAHDVRGGRLVATVTDPDGNVLGLLRDR